MRRRVRLCSRLLLAAVAGLCALPAQAVAARPLLTGFTDPIFQSPVAAERADWLGRAAGEGGNVVRLIAFWSVIAPGRPAGAADDPANPAYDWSSTDAAIRDATAQGLQVLLTVYGTPTWAEGPGRPANAPAGSWQPDTAAFGTFMRAAAARYSGSFQDPAAPGAVLAPVRYWQIWNEPNLDSYLSPQNAAPLYRQLLNTGYDAIHSRISSAVVLAAGTAPYGDLQAGGRRTPPVDFDRSLMCLTARLRSDGCADPPHFDVLAHHPYGIRGPLQHALNSGDVAVPDLGKLTRVLSAGQRAGTILPRGSKPLWVTEISWDSRPPDPTGVPAARMARWLEQSFYVLWRQGVQAVLWFRIRDEAPDPSFSLTTQSGTYLQDGQAKTAATAFRFPFVVDRDKRRSRTALAWGRAPASGVLLVQVRQHRSWRTLARLRVRRGQVFTRRVRARRRSSLRASIGGQQSLSWRVG